MLTTIIHITAALLCAASPLAFEGNQSSVPGTNMSAVQVSVDAKLPTIGIRKSESGIAEFFSRDSGSGLFRKV